MDLVIFYECITKEIINHLSNNEKILIYKNVPPNKKYLLEEILETQNADKLHSLIMDLEKTIELASLRGKIAEVLVLKDLENISHFGVNLYKNEDIRYFNKRYYYGTKIDGIMMFYNEEKFQEIVKILKQLEHIQVKSNWD